MLIEFCAIGLVFTADVNYTPGEKPILTGAWENAYEGSDSDVEFNTLLCNGTDALFLMDSMVSEKITDAALEVCEDRQIDYCDIWDEAA